MGLALAHFLWQGAALAVLAVLVLAFLRRARPVARYLALLALFVAMAAAPMVTFALATQPPGPAVMTQTEMTRLLTEAAKERGRAVSALRGEARHSPPSLARVPRQPLLSRVWEGLRQAWRSAQRRLPAAALGWMLGVLVLSLRLLARWGLLVRSKRRGLPLREARWQEAVASLSQRLGVKRTVEVLQSALVVVPTVFGWLRPVILLPPAAVLGLTPEQLEAVLAHELAHIRRHDFLVNLFQAVVETLLFYHPAAWWLSRRLRVEREHCCDDLAAAACGDLLTYASGLAALEAARARHWEPALAASGGSLLLRLRRLAGAQSVPAPHGLHSWLTAALPVMAVALLVFSSKLASASLPGTLVYEEAAATRRFGFACHGDVARVVSGRAQWTVPQLSPVHAVDYSPKGDQVLFWRAVEDPWHTPPERCASDIWKAGLDPSGRPDLSRAVNLTAALGIGGYNAEARWSPDGGAILFTHWRPSAPFGVQLWVMNADGSGAHQIRIPGRVYREASALWAADGSGIMLIARTPRPQNAACRSGCGAFLVDPDGGRIRQLRVKDAVMSPDGQWIVGTRDLPPMGVIPLDTAKGWYHPTTGSYRWELVLVHPDGTGERTVLSRSYLNADLPDDPCVTAIALMPHDLAWSPDSRRIAFVSAMNWDRKGPPITKQIELFIYDLPSGQLIQVTHDNLEQCTPVWME